MKSFQLSISPHKQVGGRFITAVRREIQKALAEEKACSGTTQADIARELGVHRSVINRQISGVENMTIGRVGEIAYALGREPVFSLQPIEQTCFANDAGMITTDEGCPLIEPEACTESLAS